MNYEKIADPSNWAIVKEEMNRQFAKGSSASETISTFGPTVTVVNGGNSTEAFQGAVAAPNGKIYLMPYAGIRIQQIDLATQTPSTVGTAQAYVASISGALGPGGKIYRAPHQEGDFVALNTNNNVLENYGTDTNLSLGLQAYSNSVVAPNGKVYYIPGSESYVRYLNLSDNTVGRIPTVLAGGFGSGILAPNGNIYMTPFGSNYIQYIDTKDDTIHTINTNIPGSDKYIGGILAPNGKIYLVPFNSTDFRYINTEDNSTNTFGPTLPGSPAGKFNGSVLAPNGKIYLVPYNETSFYSIDTANDSVSTFGANPGTTSFRGGALSPDGKIYLAPHLQDNYYYIDTKSVGSFCDPIRLSYYWNKM
ncbi:hypothetical protein [Leptospira idonii]|uniref:Uncharacterized protein n=1 Tax=Leptospira idonii TaxID=1193500 RepID=A0A4R9LXE2_9LEPT|nr:hypothetical protein [Leptospira idonii]TGN18221.1 hypothetical protein EHS15_12475 [Leptospira idonii]